MSESHRTAGKRRRWLKVLAGLALVAAGWLIVQSLWEQRRLDTLLDELREQGRPVVLADMDLDMPTVDENAAIDYRLANGEFQKAYNPAGNVRYAEFPETLWNPCRTAGRKPVEPFTAEELDELAQLIDAFEPGWKHIESAYNRPYCQFVDYHGSDVIGTGLRDLALARSVARTLALKAHWELYSGNPEAALEWTTRGLRFAEQMSREGTLIAGLVRIAVTQIALDTLQDILYEAPAEVQVPDEISEILNRMDWPAYTRRILESERVLMDVIERQQGLTSANPVHRFWKNHTQFHVVRFMTTLEDAAVMTDLEERADVLAAMEIEYAVAGNPASFTNRIGSIVSGKVMAQILGPAMSRSLDAFDRARVLADFARLALELRAYKRAHGEYPEQLQHLELETLPLDPFSLEPYRYRREEDGFRLYSYGMDRDDDGGHGPHKPEQGDLVWCAVK